MTMNDKSIASLLPWIAVAVMAYMLFVRQPAQNPDNPKPPKPATVNVSKILDGCYKADRASRLDVLRQLAKSADKTDEQKLQLFNSESEKKRQSDFRSYVEIVAEALVNGTVEDLAKRLEAGR